MVFMDIKRPVHVFDSHNVSIIFDELDTFYDFSSYLNAKIDALRKYDALVYCGEEDLLAHYFHNFDEKNKKHFIGKTGSDVGGLIIGEGEWKDLIELDIYKKRKKANEISYHWDELIQKTCQNTLNGTILGNSTPLRGKSAIHEMAKEPRFHRRLLAERMIQAIRTFPESSHPIMRNITFITSFYEEKAYVFLQLKVDNITDYDNDYRPKRQAMLKIACGAAKNKFHHLEIIIGIAIDAPKYAQTNSEDFILMDCTDWSSDDRKQYEEANMAFGFFKTASVKQMTINDFPAEKKPIMSSHRKPSRNSPCPCGSGIKFKKCCIDKDLS